MAELTQNPISFPWQMFMEAQKMKNQNQQDMYGNIAGMGQGLGTIGQSIAQQNARTALQKALDAIRNPGQSAQNNMPIPNFSPETGGAMSVMPSGAPVQPPQASTGTATAQAPALDPSMLFRLGNDAYGADNPFKSILADAFDPLKQSSTRLNTARANKLEGQGSGQSVTKYYNPQTGEYSASQKPGFQAVQIPATEDYRYFNEGKNRDAKLGLVTQKEINGQWKDLQKMVNPFRSQGVGGASSVFNKAAVSNQAAARGLAILRKKSLTWQELNAYVNSDIASIQRSGTPTDIQLHESNYNTLVGKLGAFQTFLTGTPTTGLVPDATRRQVEQNILDIIGVDNQIIDDGIDYAEQAYPDAIKAFPTRWEKIKEKAQMIKTVGVVNRAMSEPSIPEANGDGWSYVGAAQ